MRLLFSIISVRAKSFAEREIRYTLKAQNKGAGTFNIGPTTGNVRLAKDLDFEDHRYPHVYSLIVTATEDSGGFSTSVEVTHLHPFTSISKFTFESTSIPIDFSIHSNFNGHFLVSIRF